MALGSPVPCLHVLKSPVLVPMAPGSLVLVLHVLQSPTLVPMASRSPVPLVHALQSQILWGSPRPMGSLVPCLLGCLVPVFMPLGYSDSFLHVPVFPVYIPTLSGSVVLCLCVLRFPVAIHVTLACSVPCLCVPGSPVPVAVCPCPHSVGVPCGSFPVPIPAASGSLVPCFCVPVSPSLWQRCPLSPTCARLAPCSLFLQR